MQGMLKIDMGSTCSANWSLIRIESCWQTSSNYIDMHSNIFRIEKIFECQGEVMEEDNDLPKIGETT